MKAYLAAVFLFLISKIAQYYAFMPAWGRSYADDLLLIPLVLGTGLLIQQRWVSAEFKFSIWQVILTITIFSVLFEVFIPRWNPAFTSDLFDAAAYAGGGLYFWFLQNYPAVKESV